MRKYIINYNLKPGKTEKMVFGSVAKACEFCKTLNESNIAFSMAVKDYEPEWHEIDLCRPTDTLFEWLLKKANEDMYINRDSNEIPYNASGVTEALAKIVSKCKDGFSVCDCYLAITETYDLNQPVYEWDVLDDMTNADDYTEVYHIVIDDDPYLYKLIK